MQHFICLVWFVVSLAFYSVMRMHSAVCTVARCLSTHLSVRYTLVLHWYQIGTAV